MTQAELDFSAYIAERTRDFTGREWLFATIDHWLARPQWTALLLIAGEPGIGKSIVVIAPSGGTKSEATRVSMPR